MDLGPHRTIREFAGFVMTSQFGDRYYTQWLPLGTHPDMLNIGGDNQVRRVQLLRQQPCHQVLIDNTFDAAPSVAVTNHWRPTAAGGNAKDTVLE